jgi:hypothetical protein
VVVVSEFWGLVMINYKLDQQISSEKLISEINKLISKESGNLTDKILHITIKTITSSTNSLIPKLEYKNPG